MAKKLWYAPIDACYITQGFGENPQYYKKYGMPGHNGTDFRTRFFPGQNINSYNKAILKEYGYSWLGKREIYSVADGVIEQARYDRNGYGTHIRLRLKTGELVIYGHLQSILVKKGAIVAGGVRIALSDNTGDSTAPHLHFEVRPTTGNAANYYGAVDPMPYLKECINPENGDVMTWAGNQTVKLSKCSKCCDLHCNN